MHDRAEVFVAVVVFVMKVWDLRRVSDTVDMQKNILGMVHTKANIEEAFFANAMPIEVSSLDVSSWKGQTRLTAQFPSIQVKTAHFIDLFGMRSQILRSRRRTCLWHRLVEDAESPLDFTMCRCVFVLEYAQPVQECLLH